MVYDTFFGALARVAGLTAAELSHCKVFPQPDPSIFEALNKAIGANRKGETVLLCLDDFLIMQYEQTLSWRWRHLINPRTHKRIQHANEIIDPSNRLTAENLRTIFVLIEVLVYKCVLFRLECGRSDYVARSEDYDKRIRRCEHNNMLSASEAQVARELYLTRCHFAHSIKPIEDIPYMSFRLEERWRANGTMRQKELTRFFLADAYHLTSKLLSIFKPIQTAQFDLLGLKRDLLDLLDR